MIESLTAAFKAYRRAIQVAFLPDTVAPGPGGWNQLMPSSGHCALVSILVRRTFGGDYVSAMPGGVSHWFNRLTTPAGSFDVDLTGDQFGRPRVQVAPAGELYTGTRVRLESHLNAETLRRFELFARRIP